jgi:hypothetical protein
MESSGKTKAEGENRESGNENLFLTPSSLSVRDATVPAVAEQRLSPSRRERNRKRQSGKPVF